MIEFVDCTNCTDCPLHEAAEHPGLPTRPYAVTGKKKALLVVGQSPGKNEDRQGKIWIGYAGKLLEKFLDNIGFAEYADIYLTNTCRCVVPQGSKPRNSQIKACHKHLIEDIKRLRKEYEEIIILACGLPAAYSIEGFSSLKEAFRYQGCKATDPGIDVKACFFTYHPAILHPSRKPALVRAVQAHFDLVSRYLRGEFIPNALMVIPEVGAKLPTTCPDVTAVDIETYGILAGKEQTVFVPIKSKIVDGVEYEDQVVTVAFAYRDEKGDIKTPLYVFKNGVHRERIREWFRLISTNKRLLIGQNLKYDLLYQAAADKELFYWINPLRLRVDDTLLVGFLLYEQQPEQGLKERATLFGIADYNGVKDILGRAKSAWDPEENYYNCLDSAATLVLYEECWARIKERYGEDSFKLTKECADLRNAIIWDTFQLEQDGVAFDTERLTALHTQLTEKREAIFSELEREGIIAQGEGSSKSLRNFIGESLEECGLLNDKRVMFTRKTKEIAIKKENIALLLDKLPAGPRRLQLEKLQEHRAASKLVDSFTTPLLTDKRKGLTYKDGRVSFAHPTWYPMPGYHSRGASSEEKGGGTIQGRFSAQKPSIPTFPKQIMGCLTTRHKRGILAGFDLSQIELRMAALQSGDPLLMEAYEKGLDLHLQDAPIIFPDLDLTRPDIKNSRERHLLKTLNFLVLYRGGPRKYQETARNKVGIELDLRFCRATIDRWYSLHHHFREWQDRLIEDVRQKGYMELPTGWSRTFATGRGTDTYLNEICNFPIQTLSAQLFQSAQFEILRGIKRRRWSTKMVSNTYDSLLLDIPTEEIDEVRVLVDKTLRRPPLLAVIEEWTGRTIPIEYEETIYASYPSSPGNIQ